MASCIEAFLRGSEPMFQKFVAKSGMLEYLINDIVAEGPKVQGGMQTSFDLLGELMKFNREVCRHSGGFPCTNMSLQIFHSFNALLVREKQSKFFGIQRRPLQYYYSTFFD